MTVAYAGGVFIYKNISGPIAAGILEYLRVIIWPIVVLTAAFSFRSDISSFLRRLIRGKNPLLGEWEASPEAIQQQENTQREVTQPMGEAFAEITVQKEAEIRALQNNNQQLIDALTKAQIELDFERIYNLIFANQIDLLNEVNTLGGEVALEYVGAHLAKVHQVFEGVKDWDIFKYLEYLINNQLVEYKTGVGNFISITITVKGRAFISYLTARSYKKYGL